MKKVLFILFIGIASTAIGQEVQLKDNSSVNWVTIEEAIRQVENGENSKTIIIDAYTDWCGWCKRMDKTTFVHPEVVKTLNENFLAVKFDAEAKRDIEFRGNTLKFVASGRNGYHELAAALLQGKLSYPTLVFLNENFEMIQPIGGYRTGEQLLPIIKFLGEKHYLNTSWKKFSKEYQSSTEDGQ